MLTAVAVRSPASEAPVPRSLTVTLLFGGAIVVGCVLGTVAPAAGGVAVGWVDRLVLLLVALLWFDLRLDGVRGMRTVPRTALLALGTNFLVVPLIAAGLSLLVPEPAVRLGFVIYCLAPCTDWFLGFTRMGRGDTATGAALLPVQMVLQLVLYPVWIAVFTGSTVPSTVDQIGPTLLIWFVLPAAVGVAARLVVRVLVPRHRAAVGDVASRAVPFVIAALIVCLFAANVGIVLDHPGAFAGLLPVVVLFFVVTYVVGELLGRRAGLGRPEQVLLTMTTSARNAPLMLAVTTVALPGQPLVAAAVVLGMLIEFPHLTALAHLARRRGRATTVDAPRR